MPDRDQLYVGGDFNGSYGRNHSGNEETVGVGESNKAGDNFVAFAMSNIITN